MAHYPTTKCTPITLVRARTPLLRASHTSLTHSLTCSPRLVCTARKVWTKLATEGSAPSPRFGHPTVLWGKYLVVLGGVSIEKSEKIPCTDVHFFCVGTLSTRVVLLV